MQYRLHDNGWTVFLDDINFKEITQDQVLTISKLIAKYTLVIARNQKLDIDTELKIVNMFKEPLPMISNKSDPSFYDTAADLEKDPDGVIQKVGQGGIASHKEEMVWHCNDPANPNRRPIIWLHSIYGSKGSVTSYNNSAYAYNDLSNDQKEKLSKLKLVLKTNASMNDADINEPEELAKHNVSNLYKPNLITTNNAGKTGIFYPFNQTSHLEPCTEQENKEYKDWLSKYITQEKYVYHHEWNDGDIVMAEQWLGIHKRHYFDEIGTRLLHRAAFDFPDQDYKQ